MKKIRTIMLSMLAVVALASCSKDDNGGIPTPIGNDNAYLSIALTTSAPNTYAVPATNSGTAAESGLDGGAIVVGFGSDKSTVKGVYAFGNAAPELGTIGGNQGSTAVHGAAFKVNEDIRYVFVILNPTEAITNQINVGTTTYAAMNKVITTETIDKLVVDKKFLMTSAGVNPDDKGLVEVTPKVAISESDTDIAAAKEEAEDAPAIVKVDRVVAKLQLFVSDEFEVEFGANAEIVGWKANATNTKYLPYAELVNYAQSSEFAKYRKDANYTELGTAYATELNWLDNNNNTEDGENHIIWNAPISSESSSEYVFENTMEEAAQNYNNTTKVTIKAKYTPASITPVGSSWFRMDGNVYTLNELQDIYKKAETPQSTKTYMDAFYDAMKAVNTSITAANFGTLTIEELNNVKNGGYVASTVSSGAIDYMIEFFQKSECYYEVNLKHDNRVESGLGRWGIVRNNFYTLTVSKISKAGKPYIVDPTDPYIVDPENPEPDKPKPNDEATAYISVSVSINPWTFWSQDIEL